MDLIVPLQITDSSLFCRTCLTETFDLKPLGDNDLINILTACTSVQVHKHERNKMICSYCSQLLTAFNDFRIRCLEVDEIVKTSLGLKNEQDDHMEGVVKAEPVFESSNDDHNWDGNDDDDDSDKDVTPVKCRVSKSKITRSQKRLLKSQKSSKSSTKYRKKVEKKLPCNVCVYCTKLFADKHRLKSHMSAQHSEYVATKDVRKCPYCSKSFRCLKLITKHLNMSHKKSQGAIKCEKCNEKFHIDEQLTFHTHKVHDQLQCKICLKQMDGVYKLKSHIQRHGRKYLTQNDNSDDDEQIKQEDGLLLEEKTLDILKSRASRGNPAKEFKCDFCPKTFPKPAYARRHMYLHTNEPSYKCRECDKAFPQINLLTKHVRYYHPSEPQFKCNVCGEKFYVEVSLKKHHARAHEDKLCRFCDKRTKTAKALNRHIKRVHPTTGPLTCPHCSKTFKLKVSLKLHIERAHNGVDTRKICNICGLKLSNVEKHMHAVHKIGKRTFTCRRCDAKFDNANDARKHSLENHMKKREPGDYTYECHMCHKKLLNKANLESHYKVVHTAKKPLFKCTICSKEMKFKQSFKLHMLSHTSERPYECDFCDKKFYAKYMVTRHRRTHTGEMRYACAVCDRRFIHYTSYTLHKKTHYNGDALANEVQTTTGQYSVNRRVSRPFNDDPTVYKREDETAPIDVKNVFDVVNGPVVF